MPADVPETTCTSSPPQSAQPVSQRPWHSGACGLAVRRAACVAAGRLMRECNKCGRSLPDKRFAGGTNWRTCMRCKSHQVQVRKYEREGRQEVVEAWRASGMEYIQDFARRQRILAMPVRVSGRTTPLSGAEKQRTHFALLMAAQIATNAEYFEQLAFFQQRARRRTYQLRWNAKSREARRLNPEIERAKERAKRAHNPGLYKALSQASSAARRQRMPTGRKRLSLDVVWALADGRCGICGDPCDPGWWHLDHVVPLASGGEHVLGNVAPAHPYCNLHKGARTNDKIDVAWLRETRLAWETSSAGLRARGGGAAPCGTEQRYCKGCRCDECRAAHAEASRARRSRNRRPSRRGPKTPSPTRQWPDSAKFRALREAGVRPAVAAREAGITTAHARALER